MLRKWTISTLLCYTRSRTWKMRLLRSILHSKRRFTPGNVQGTCSHNHTNQRQLSEVKRRKRELNSWQKAWLQTLAIRVFQVAKTQVKSGCTRLIVKRFKEFQSKGISWWNICRPIRVRNTTIHLTSRKLTILIHSIWEMKTHFNRISHNQSYPTKCYWKNKEGKYSKYRNLWERRALSIPLL